MVSTLGPGGHLEGERDTRQKWYLLVDFFRITIYIAINEAFLYQL